MRTVTTASGVGSKKSPDIVVAILSSATGCTRLEALVRRGWVNTAALLGSGSLIRYESVLEALRPLGGEVARVSAWSRGERSRPACGRSVSGGQPNDDENCVVLLVAAVHGRHGRPRIHRKTLCGSVRRRARV